MQNATPYLRAAAAAVLLVGLVACGDSADDLAGTYVATQTTVQFTSPVEIEHTLDLDADGTARLNDSPGSWEAQGDGTLVVTTERYDPLTLERSGDALIVIEGGPDGLRYELQ